MASIPAHHGSHLHPAKPLVVRGGLGRTFGSLVIFLALTLLAFGGYILADAFAHPVDAQAAGLITAAFIIALGLLLLFYLLKPRKSAGAVRRRAHRHRSAKAMMAASRIPSKTTGMDEPQADLAYQRVYVDHSRIRA
ncbi:MAG TPA: hypothetical protein VEI73_15310 [Candidatus Acidoferrum sp.]|nr:hypothetical protein [Candidatus Acidoferrum sp.]